jgi:trans-aconitate methyltransferase
MKETLKRLKEHYEPRIRPDSLGYQILDWESQESQFCRFEVLLRRIPLEGRTLLDLGCGVGDLCAFLASRDLSVDYTGVDILEEMIKEARRRCPEGRFIHADLLKENPFGEERFDVAFCSGIFNLETGDNAELLTAFMGRLSRLVRGTVVINLLSVSSPDRLDRYHYFDPQAVLREAREFFDDVMIDESYLCNDFTLICSRAARGTPADAGGRSAT